MPGPGGPPAPVPTQRLALQVKPLLLGASNAWFPLTRSVLAIPASADRLTSLLLDLTDQLAAVTSPDDVAPAMKFNPALAGSKGFDAAEVLATLTRLRGQTPDGGPDDTVSLLRPEWDVLTRPATAPNGEDFRLLATNTPPATAPTSGMSCASNACVRSSP